MPKTRLTPDDIIKMRKLREKGLTQFVIAEKFGVSQPTVSAALLGKLTFRKLNMDLRGKRFGRLLVVAPAERRLYNQTTWMCRCDCGKTKVTITSSLTRGLTQSCGCLQRERTGAAQMMHGDARKGRVTKEHQTWRGALRRCYNPNTHNYHRYGGRGIVMCDEWRLNYAAFLRDMGRCPPGCSLDRIDNNGPYAPGNCRWATAHEQIHNRSNSRHLAQKNR